MANNPILPVQTLTPTATQTSAPVRAPAGTEISVAITSGTCTVDYTYSPLSAVQAGTATWVVGGIGTYSASTSTPVKIWKDCFVRVACSSGSVSVTVDPQGQTVLAASSPTGEPGSSNLSSLQAGFDSGTPTQQAAFQASVSWDATLRPAPYRRKYATTLHIKQDGTGDYSSISAALAGIAGALPISETTRIQLAVHAPYKSTEYGLFIPSWVDVIGYGLRENIRIDGALADTAPISTINSTSTFDVFKTSIIANITVTAKNMRYCFHVDDGATPTHNNNVPATYGHVNIFDNVYAEHYGNAGAIAAQGSTVWQSPYAIGSGTHGGHYVLLKGCKFIGPSAAIYFHSNPIVGGPFPAPSRIDIDACELIGASATDYCALFGCLGSGQTNIVTMTGCTLVGVIGWGGLPWTSSDPAYQPSDPCQEFKVSVSGSSPALFNSSTEFYTLEWRAYERYPSTIRISGTGADALFGKNPIYFDGGYGLQGFVRSSHSITNPASGVISTNTLAARLGNCAASPKSITFVIDGSALKTYTINLAIDYSGMSNAAIISQLNGLVDAASGTVANYPMLAVQPFVNVPPLNQADRVVSRTSEESSYVIKRGHVVAKGTKKGVCRRAVDTDLRANILGIALDDIGPGGRGRIQVSGELQSLSLLLNGVTKAVGNTYQAQASPYNGYIVNIASGAPILRCIDVSKAGYEIFEII